MRVSERIADVRERLTPAERRVAEVVLADPEAVAFGTVASLAARASTSGPTVVRTAAKLGLPGFVGLQAAVQEELAQRLRPAAERIRRRPERDPVTEARDVEMENVHATLTGVDPEAFARVVDVLADPKRRIGILSGDASFGVAMMLADMLAMLRDGVELVSGSEVRVARRLAGFGKHDALVAVDLRRYDRWLLEHVRRAAEAGIEVVAVTDSLLSPLAELATDTFVVDAQGAGPFDSHVGTLALANALAAGVATKLRRSATTRLDRIERAWTSADALVPR